MSMKVQNYLAEKIIWKRGSNSTYPYVGDFEGDKCLIRVNDFPDEHLYTLIVNDREIASFDDWPTHWHRP